MVCLDERQWKKAEIEAAGSRHGFRWERPCGIYCNVYHAVFCFKGRGGFPVECEVTSDVCHATMIFRMYGRQASVHALHTILVRAAPAKSPFRGMNSSSRPILRGQKLTIWHEIYTINTRGSYVARRTTRTVFLRTGKEIWHRIDAYMTSTRKIKYFSNVLLNTARTHSCIPAPHTPTHVDGPQLPEAITRSLPRFCRELAHGFTYAAGTCVFRLRTKSLVDTCQV